MLRKARNPYLVFLPFLLIYVVIVWFLHKDVMEGDEGRYYMYAQNLLHGYYSPKDEVYLWNGPGYPLLLVPFLLLKLPLIAMVMMNAFYYYLSVVYLYKALALYVSPRKAFLFSLFWACYYIAFKEMGWLYTESFTLLLITAFQYYIAKSFGLEGNKKHLVVAGFLLGWLVLTKVIFAYVLMAMMVLAVIGFVWKRNRHCRQAIVVLCVAFIVNLPYLFYTYHLTHKPLYWANSGGSSLYWASSPYAGEFGDWNNESFTTYCDVDTLLPCNAALIARNHATDFVVFNKLKGIERDEAFKRKAISNIKARPLKYLKNYVSNAGRMLFGVPQSFFYQRFENLMRIPPNAIVFVMLLLSTFISIYRFRSLRFEVGALVIMSAIYFFGSALLSADQRQFYIIVPCILLWTACLLQQTVKLIESY